MSPVFFLMLFFVVDGERIGDMVIDTYPNWDTCDIAGTAWAKDYDSNPDSPLLNELAFTVPGSSYTVECHEASVNGA